MTEPHSIFDFNDRYSAEYKLGVHQLKQWKERCRCKRLGIKFSPLKLRESHGHKKTNKGCGK